jgi:GH15 family glucan-1,4-alpha-glucosidase
VSTDDWEHIRDAADYVAAEGPDAGQERWENQGGWSRNTIAIEIAGLICAADVAEANGDDKRAADYRELAELIAGQNAAPRLATMAGTANDGLMLPEQVWDGRPGGKPAGTGTRSATPLAWTHAQFVRLAWSIDAGEPIERPSVVACRYQETDC